MKLGEHASTTSTTPASTSPPLLAQSFQAKRRQQKINEIQAAKNNQNNVVSNAPVRKHDLQSIVDAQGGRTGYISNALPSKSRQTVLNSNTNRNNLITDTVKETLGQARQPTYKNVENRPSPNKNLPPLFYRDHVVVAIAENLARDTCLASVDALNPSTLSIIKHANSLTYAETLMALDLLNPDEILLNEGRRSAPLSMKIHSFYENKADQQASIFEKNKPDSNSQELETDAVVKFLPRSFFDQTKGTELLRRVCRPSTYSPELLEEFIIPAAANATLGYVQNSLGAVFSNHSLALSLNEARYNKKMSMDRSTIINLELLANARSVRDKASLLNTIDNTVTSVGSKLLRSNLMAPSTSEATINARLDLIDTFLGDEVLFYNTLEMLERLPDLDKTLSGLVLKPQAVTKKNVTVAHTARGIASLVCMKTALQVSFVQYDIYKCCF